MKGVNIWEHCRPYDLGGMTWHPRLPYKRPDHYLKGQRLDHFIVSEKLIHRKQGLQIRSINTYQGVGSSDHCPLVLRFKNNRVEQNNNNLQDDPTIHRLETKNSQSRPNNPQTRQGPTLIDSDTGRRKIFDSYESPIIKIIIEGEEEEVFIDSSLQYFQPTRQKSRRRYTLQNELHIQRSRGRKNFSKRKQTPGHHSGVKNSRMSICIPG